MKVERKEFEGNILVTISDDQVRLWVCDQRGVNIFRFKAMGKVYKAGQEITVMPNNMFNPIRKTSTGRGKTREPRKEDQNGKV